MKVSGTKYRMPCVLVIGKTDEDQVLFGEVTRILVDIKSVIFEFKLFRSYFNHHFHCYCLISPETTHYAIPYSHLIHYHPYGLYYSSSINSEYPQCFSVLRSVIE